MAKKTELMVAPHEHRTKLKRSFGSWCAVDIQECKPRVYLQTLALGNSPPFCLRENQVASDAPQIDAARTFLERGDKQKTINCLFHPSRLIIPSSWKLQWKWQESVRLALIEPLAPTNVVPDRYSHVWIEVLHCWVAQSGGRMFSPKAVWTHHQSSPVIVNKNESGKQLAIKINHVNHVFVFFPMSPLQMICKILEHANLFPTLGLRTVQLTGKVTGEWHPSHQSCVVSVGLHSARPGRIASHIFFAPVFFLASSQI